MRKIHLLTTVLGAAVLVFGVANAGPGGGMSGGMGAGVQSTPTGGMAGQPEGMSPTAGQNASTDTCGDNTATRIPCTTHKDKAKAKTKGAAAADTSGANANAKTKSKAKADPNAAGVSGSADTSASTTTTPATPPDSPH